MTVAISGQRSRRTSNEELELVRRPVSHLQRAFKLYLQLAGSRALVDASFAVLDRLPMGIILLDQDGRIRFANRAAEAIIRQGDGFSVDQDQRCRAGVGAENAKLQKLIHEAIQTGRGQGQAAGGALTLTRLRGVRPLSVVVSPLCGHGLAIMEHLYAVLFISEPDSTDFLSDEDLLRQLYGLTRAEARLAQALSSGVSLEEYAEQRDVSRNTVRT